METIPWLSSVGCWVGGEGLPLQLSPMQSSAGSFLCRPEGGHAALCMAAAHTSGSVRALQSQAGRAAGGGLGSVHPNPLLRGKKLASPSFTAAQRLHVVRAYSAGPVRAFSRLQQPSPGGPLWLSAPAGVGVLRAEVDYRQSSEHPTRCPQAGLRG